ncbi:hypothetical protein AQ1_02027 [alpha proteobacterium Q-1]|nr:hypothetical protein AQ1_02027 [alpha proteobacterium Q-1]
MRLISANVKEIGQVSTHVISICRAYHFSGDFFPFIQRLQITIHFGAEI